MDGGTAWGAAVDDHRRRGIFADTAGAGGIYFSAAVAHCVDREKLFDDMENLSGGQRAEGGGFEFRALKFLVGSGKPSLERRHVIGADVHWQSRPSIRGQPNR